MAFPGTYNISYYSGDTYEFNVYPKDSSGATFNLNDYNTAKFTIAESRGASTIIVAQAEISGTKDYVACAIPPNVGSTLDPSKTYVYDVQVGYPASPYDYVYTLLTGNISVTEDVTPSGAANYAPNAPIDFEVTAFTSTTATVTWAAPVGGTPVTGYYVGKSTTPLDAESYAPPTADLGPGIFTYTFTGLSPSTLYGLAVQAYNDGGPGLPAGGTVITAGA
jgi:hypothetical protein